MGTDGEIAGSVLWQVGCDAAADAGGVDPELLGGFLAGVAGAVAAGRRLPRGQVQRCRGQGEQAARAGVSLPAVLDLYLSAAWRLWRHLPVVRDAAGPRADPAVLVTAGEVMLRAVDDAAAALAQGYQQARRGVVREQEASRRELVDDLLSGSGDVAGLLERAAGFGLDLSGPHAVAVVDADRAFSDATPVMGIVERAVQDESSGAGAGGAAAALVTSKDARLVVIFAAGAPGTTEQVIAAITAVLGPAGSGAPGVQLRRRVDVGAWRLGLGRPRPGSAGVLASYEDARSALDLASRLGLDGPVVRAADLLVFQVLLRDRTAIVDLVDALLTPLAQARGGAAPLLDTLAAYFDAGGNAAHAARAMHLSVRALTYRLDRVRQLTGHDPVRSSQRFALHAAVLGAKLLGWPDVPLTA